MRHRQSLHNTTGIAQFGARGLEKLEPRRRGEEKIADLDSCSLRVGIGPQRSHSPRFHSQTHGLGTVRGATGHRQAGHRGNRREGLAAETQCRNVDEIVVRQFRGRMAFESEEEFRFRHAMAVVAHQDETAPAIAQNHLDLSRTCVEGVFDQLLYGSRRPFDHFARGDAIDEGFRQTANSHARPSSR